tara:strand:- start:3829 stop:4101 length:273 start_codon:yes stop_codon:yes gene_type:complete
MAPKPKTKRKQATKAGRSISFTPTEGTGSEIRAIASAMGISVPEYLAWLHRRWVGEICALSKQFPKYEMTLENFHFNDVDPSAELAGKQK